MGVVSNVIKTLKKGISGGKEVVNSAYGYYNPPRITDSCIYLFIFIYLFAAGGQSHICWNENNSLNP